jgi:hypothetical protein
MTDFSGPELLGSGESQQPIDLPVGEEAGSPPLRRWLDELGIPARVETT